MLSNPFMHEFRTSRKYNIFLRNSVPFIQVMKTEQITWCYDVAMAASEDVVEEQQHAGTV